MSQRLDAGVKQYWKIGVFQYCKVIRQNDYVLDLINILEFRDTGMIIMKQLCVQYWNVRTKNMLFPPLV